MKIHFEGSTATPTKPEAVPRGFQHFDRAPDSALVDIPTACAVATCSRATVYRHHHAGRLPFHKIGKLTRIRVGDLRRLIGAA